MDFHDAVFESIQMSWGDGLTTISVRASDGRRTLLIRDTREVRLSRRAPWGPSIHVNTLQEMDTEDGVRLEIELQSGDTVVVEGVSLDENASQQDR
jgi:hypothetical protein